MSEVIDLKTVVEYRIMPEAWVINTIPTGFVVSAGMDDWRVEFDNFEDATIYRNQCREVSVYFRDNKRSLDLLAMSELNSKITQSLLNLCKKTSDPDILELAQTFNKMAKLYMENSNEVFLANKH